MEEDQRKKPRQKNFWVTAGEYSALGFILPSCVFAGYLIGSWLDRTLGTTYLDIVFLLLGIVGGFIQIFRFLKKHE